MRFFTAHSLHFVLHKWVLFRTCSPLRIPQLVRCRPRVRWCVRPFSSRRDRIPAPLPGICSPMQRLLLAGPPVRPHLGSISSKPNRDRSSLNEGVFKESCIKRKNDETHRFSEGGQRSCMNILSKNDEILYSFVQVHSSNRLNTRHP